MKQGISIPCHWNKEIMAQMLHRPVPEGGLAITEIYGTVAGNPLRHGRADSTVPSVSREQAIEFREFVRKEGVTFTYLLNAPYSLENSSRIDLDSYLDWVLKVLQPDALSISSYELMKLVREKDSSIAIHISTIAGVRNARDLQRFQAIYPRKVTLHHDLGKDWKALAEVVEYANVHNIDVELLVTESCLYNCPIRDKHYAYLARPGRATDLEFHLWCQSKKVGDPSEFLRAGAAIRPEDLSLLEQQGVGLFKISGRDRAVEEIPPVVAAYQARHFDGNFIDLLDVTPALKKGWAYISNRALDGFLEHYPQNSIDSQKAYCQMWAVRLFERGDFYVKGATYAVCNGQLVRVGEPSTNRMVVFNQIKQKFEHQSA